MSFFYSDSTKGFYELPFNKNIPEDAVPISNQKRMELLLEQTKNKEIYLNERGEPDARERVKDDGETVSELSSLIVRHFAKAAKDQGFDSMLDAISYCDERTDNVRRPKGLALRAWRTACWEVFDQMITQSPLPTEEQLLASLPVFNLPD